MQKVTIDHIDYNLQDFSIEAKAELAALQAAELEIQRLHIQLAIAQTARNAYAAALSSLLPSTDKFVFGGLT